MKIINETLIVSEKISVAIIIARFNDFINKNLLYAAIDTLQRIGMIKKNNITVIWVPGSYELPLITKLIIKKNFYDGILTIGTIIKGDTLHFKYLSQSVCSQLLHLSIKYQIPISYGVLTTNNIEQAIERSGSKIGNRGTESALTLLEMINISKKIKSLSIKKEL
ncbi:6,7-dimethyl-8-ribityllumazine synthase [Enterobacteriaceae endosymbiont of Plateumaris braccata]|uniref:6,7-dimethyl-8-ribityllumazine synthase n=1 Tax=Enterobacteriaceae endosymbiont of Plateumaris braccata TaxID=2675793 RepID=UPI001449110C|nr:6,7-dimethyl-8-ribityllumazine synthase [Enterobacteriaceae endosymbiont of Plateumaris braccata]QJC28018.1 6,7-dimethyl-8-ribityllumazine synthase [Enterobacteriaceae endosymbiont of Plateumaris braccata]